MQDRCKCNLELCHLELYFLFYIYSHNHPNCFRRYNTVQLSNPICEYVENYRGPRELLYRSCERLITRIVETHRMFFILNKSRTCYKRMVHTSLYVAARIAFRSKLPNSKVVIRLLSEIYRCDQSMRNLIMGAYLEPQDCLGICGIHPIFGSQEEGLQALQYFLHHANMVKKGFYSNHSVKRLADLSLRIVSYFHPAVYSVAIGNYSTFKLLLEYGTNLVDPLDGEPMSNSVSIKIGMPFGTPQHLRATNPMNSRLRIENPEVVHHPQSGQHYKRQPLPFSVEAAIDLDSPEISPEKEPYRILFLKEHPVISGHDIPCLMQFCRRIIRKQLYENFQLPCGIKDLPIPGRLKKYINLDID